MAAANFRTIMFILGLLSFIAGSAKLPGPNWVALGLALVLLGLIVGWAQ